MIDRALVAAGEIEHSGGLVRLRHWRPELNQRQRQLRERILGQIIAAKLETPSISELEKEHGVEVVSLLRILEEERLVVQLEADRYLAKSALDEAREILRRAMRDRVAPRVGEIDREPADSGAGPLHEFTASELREILGVSRKFLIPLLERFDKEGVTERRNTGRVLHDG
jgi:selenocysteine-specific elongation factor